MHLVISVYSLLLPVTQSGQQTQNQAPLSQYQTFIIVFIGSAFTINLYKYHTDIFY